MSSSGRLAEINPLRYRGYYYDSETGFYYLQSRYYDPANRRFINADTYSSTDPGDAIGCNMFAYCGIILSCATIIPETHGGIGSWPRWPLLAWRLPLLLPAAVLQLLQ